jgi:hypothetical protein
MERRTFLALIPASLLTAPLAAEAQQVGKGWRIGYLVPTPFRELPKKGAFSRMALTALTSGDELPAMWRRS